MILQIRSVGGNQNNVELKNKGGVHDAETSLPQKKREIFILSHF